MLYPNILPTIDFNAFLMVATIDKIEAIDMPVEIIRSLALEGEERIMAVA